MLLILLSSFHLPKGERVFRMLYYKNVLRIATAFDKFGKFSLQPYDAEAKPCQPPPPRPGKAGHSFVRVQPITPGRIIQYSNMMVFLLIS